MNKNLKEYMSSKKGFRKILIVVGAVLAAFFFIVPIILDGDKLIGCVASFANLVLVAVMLILESRSKKFYKHLAETYNWQELEADYQSAISVMNNTLRFGEKWIFVRNREQLLGYEDIAQIYQYIHRTNLVEDKRALKYKTPSGKEYVLCGLQLNGKSDEDVKRIIAILLTKNSNIRIGNN